VFAFPSMGGVWEPGEGVTMGSQVWVQTQSVLFTLFYTGIITLILLKLVDMVVGLRVSEEEEVVGLDIAMHDERGYNL
jgi:ammonium transporter, Amt family